MSQKILIIGDIHIESSAIPEIETIINEIVEIKADRVIQVGDFYHRNRPNPEELKFGTEVACVLKDKYKDVMILSGNGIHDFVNGFSVIEYLKYLGIRIEKDEYVFDNNLYGHYMLHCSPHAFGSGKKGIKDLKKYSYVFLGHDHQPCELKKNKIWHIGSIRYVSWNESEDPFKRVMVLEDNKVKSIQLKSPIPMVEVSSIEELDQIEPYSKVRWTINTFIELKNSAEIIKKYKDKFEEFKVKVDIQKEETKPQEQVDNRKLKDLIYKGIDEIKDKDVRNLLKEQFKENNE